MIEEDIQYLFFDCPLARLLWNIIVVALNLKSVLNKQNLFEQRLNNFDGNLKQLVVGVAAIIWAIQKTKNNACF